MLSCGLSRVPSRGIRTGFCVALEAQHDLGCSVPPRSDVLGHVSGILLRVHGKTSSQSKIADLKFAVGVYEQIAGLQVTMEDVRGVDVLQTTQDLVYKRLEVGVGERLAGADDGRQIALHQLCSLSALSMDAFLQGTVPSYR
jgi:hypothetical protein